MTAISLSHRGETETPSRPESRRQVRQPRDTQSPESYETDLSAGLRRASSYQPSTARHTMHRVRLCLGRSLMLPKVRKVRTLWR